MSSPTAPVRMNPLKRMAGLCILKTQGALTWVGEQVGSEWLIYNPLVHFGFKRAAQRNAPIVSSTLREVMPDVKTIVDVGCGPGLYVREFIDTGFKAIGVEYSPKLRRSGEKRGVQIFPFDVSVPTPHPPGAPFDLAVSFEVGEHISPDLADAFVKYFRGLTRRVVFSAAHPGQGGTAHINEQPREYWIKKFEANGFKYDPQTTEAISTRFKDKGAHWYLPLNVSVFLLND